MPVRFPTLEAGSGTRASTRISLVRSVGSGDLHQAVAQGQDSQLALLLAKWRHLVQRSGPVASDPLVCGSLWLKPNDW